MGLRSGRHLALTVVWLLCAACRSGTPPPAETGAALTESDVPLIPRRVLFGNPEKAGPSLSNDGNHLALLADVNGVMNVWVAPSGDLEAARPLTKDTFAHRSTSRIESRSRSLSHRERTIRGSSNRNRIKSSKSCRPSRSL